MSRQSSTLDTKWNSKSAESGIGPTKPCRKFTGSCRHKWHGLARRLLNFNLIPCRVASLFPIGKLLTDKDQAADQTGWGLGQEALYSYWHGLQRNLLSKSVLPKIFSATMSSIISSVLSHQRALPIPQPMTSPRCQGKTEDAKLHFRL